MTKPFIKTATIKAQVPSGGALGIDRVLFSDNVTKLIEENPLINIIREEVKEIPTDVPTIISSGPLTSKKLAEQIKTLTGESHLYFFDAIAPIVE